jgi:hypothetical protein
MVRHMSIEEAKKFINGVINTEFEAEYASRAITEVDYTIYLSNLKDLNSAFIHMEPFINLRSEDLNSYSEEKLSRFVKSAKDVEKRVLFKIEKHSNKTHGEIYSAFVGINSRGDLKNYFQVWYAKIFENDWKVFSIYTRDHIDGGWEYTNGEKLSNPGKLLETQKFVAPDDPDDLEDWNNN